MFERYTEKARRVIFFARYEASLFGASEIEPEHILLGIIREDKSITYRYFERSAAQSIRKEVEGRIIQGDRVSSQINMPLSGVAKRALAFAAEESERLGDRHIGTEHLLLGLLREEDSIAAEVLHSRGLRLSDIREDLMRQVNVEQRPGDDAAVSPPDEVTMRYSITEKLSRDVTKPQDRDDRWTQELLGACIDADLFTKEELESEFVTVASLRQFRADTEALLRILAAKGLVDPQQMPKLAFDLRDEKNLVEFIEKFRQQ